MAGTDRATGLWRDGAGVLVAVLALAAALRLMGLGFGLPAVYNPDEVSIMSRALAFAKGDLNPHNFLYPTFYFYVLFGWIGGYFAAGRLIGAIPSLAAFQTQFFVDPTNVFLAGRALSVVCGVASVAVTAAVARRVYGRAAALPAACFLAVAPFAVRDAHYVKHDVPATLAVLLACWAFTRVPSAEAGRARLWRVVTAGAACGAAFSTHYYTIFLALPLAVSVAGSSRGWRDALRDLAAACAAAAAVFFLLSPFLLVEIRTAAADMAANRGIVVDRAVSGQQGLFASAGAYARMLARDAMGWPVFVLALAGVPTLWLRDRRQALLLLLFPVSFLAFVSNTVPATRYLNPVLPFAAIFAAVAVAALAARFGRWRPAAALALTLAAAAPGCRDSLRTGWFFRQTDTRTLALRYVEEHITPGAGIAIQPYSVPLVQSRESLLEALRANLGDPGLASTKFALRLRLDPYPAPAYRTIFVGDGGLDADKIYVGYREFAGGRGLAALRDLGVGIVVLKRFAEPAPETVPLIRALEAEGRLLASFSPYRAGSEIGAGRPAPYLHNMDARITPALERPGPPIEVWALSKQPD